MTAEINLSYAVQRLRCYMVPDRKKPSKKELEEQARLSAEMDEFIARVADQFQARAACDPSPAVAGDHPEPGAAETRLDGKPAVPAPQKLPAIQGTAGVPGDFNDDEEDGNEDEEDDDDDDDGEEEQDERALPPATPIGQRVWEAGRPYEGYCLIFDCETTIGTDQEFRFGAYQVRGISQQARMELARHGHLTPARIQALREKFDTLEEWGLIHNKAQLTDEEFEILEKYAETARHAASSDKPKFLSKEEFVEEVFYHYAREADKVADNLLVIGHNLPFDLSRLATQHGLGRGQFFGGFRLKLCGCPNDGKKDCAFHPPVRIKKLGRGKYQYGMCKTKKPVRVGGKLVISEESNTHNIKFLDTITLAGALLGPGDKSLKTLTRKLKTLVQKEEVDYHGKLVKPEYISYCLSDVQATWEVYTKLRAIYRQHNLNRPIWQLYSEASLGKAYLDEFGFPKFLNKDRTCRHEEITPELIGQFMSTYFGGRSEIRIRLKPCEVIHTDFRSQYTTVNALMRLQELLLAERLEVRRNDPEVLDFLKNVAIQDMQKRENWERLRGIALIVPDDDILPLRAVYAPHGAANIGVNHVKSRLPVWLTFADLLASKFLRKGKLPVIQETIELVPHGCATTQELEFYGDSEYKINLREQDLFQRIVEMRIKIEKCLEESPKDERADYWESLSGVLKSTASSTSYGVLVEINTETKAKPRGAIIYDANGAFRASVNKVETPGPYFAGPIGTLIPAAGRLLLAIAEALGEERGLSYLFCDTDSMCYAKPEAMKPEIFEQKVKEITNWFTALSPYYNDSGEQLPILRFEKVNYRNGKEADGFEPLYGIAVSAKRYVLYNRVRELLKGAGRIKSGDGAYWIRLRKVSAHGTGDVAQPGDYMDAEDIAENGDDGGASADVKLIQPQTYNPHVSYLDGNDKEQTRKNKSRIVANARAADLLIDLAQHAVESIEQGKRLDFTKLAIDTPHFWQISLATAHTWKAYGERIGARPFGFATFVPSPGKSYSGREALDHATFDAVRQELRSSYYAPFTREFSEVKDHLKRFDTHEPPEYLGKMEGVNFHTLYDRLHFYFDRDEYKSFQHEGKPELARRNLVVIAQRFQGKETGGVRDDDHLDTDGAIPTDADTCYTSGAFDAAALTEFDLTVLAEESGLPQRNLERYRSGESRPRPPELELIARSLTAIKTGRQRTSPKQKKGRNDAYRSLERDQALQQNLRERVLYLVDSDFYSYFHDAFIPEIYAKAIQKLNEGKPPIVCDGRVRRVQRLALLSGLSRDKIKNFMTKGILLAERDRQTLTRAVSAAESQDWEVAQFMSAPQTLCAESDPGLGGNPCDIAGCLELTPVSRDDVMLYRWEKN